ncbi:MAG: tyrosine-protein kinase family protein [Paracoccaceae bacterium]
MERLEAALAKAREMRQTVLRDPGQPRNKPQPAVASIADWLALPEIDIGPDRARANRIMALSGAKEAVPYDILRSRVLRQLRDKSWSRLAVTSPDPACGKTTVSLNLALSLSRQRDIKVMLFDLDLRRPALHKMLGHSVTNSFWEVLERKVPFTEVSVRYGDNLAIALNNSPCRHPAELLHSQMAADVLDEIEARWRPDVMIFDLCPMLASDDNVGFLSNVDCGILVAAAESTRMSNIDLCEKELAQLTNVLGLVLNKCRYADDTVGYAYGSY